MSDPRATRPDADEENHAAPGAEADGAGVTEGLPEAAHESSAVDAAEGVAGVAGVAGVDGVAGVEPGDEREAGDAGDAERIARETDSASLDAPEAPEAPSDFAQTEPPAFDDAEETTVNMTGGELDAVAIAALRDDAAKIEEDDDDEDEDDVRLSATSGVTRQHLKGLLEALIFVSDKPIKTHDLAKAAAARRKEVRDLLAELKSEYATRGVQLDEVAGGWIFRTNPQFAPFVRDLTKQRPVKLSRAQVETLAILAYRQPITRPEIDDIRGVDCGAVLKVLLDRDLIRILGKKDEPGRPLLYGTTHAFLEFFGLKSLKDLPTLREFTELNEDSRRVVERELGEVLEGPSVGASEPPVVVAEGNGADEGDAGGAPAEGTDPGSPGVEAADHFAHDTLPPGKLPDDWHHPDETAEGDPFDTDAGANVEAARERQDDGAAHENDGGAFTGDDVESEERDADVGSAVDDETASPDRDESDERSDIGPNTQRDGRGGCDPVEGQSPKLPVAELAFAGCPFEPVIFDCGLFEARPGEQAFHEAVALGKLADDLDDLSVQ